MELEQVTRWILLLGTVSEILLIQASVICSQFACTSIIWVYSKFGGFSYGLQQSYTSCWGPRQQQSLSKVLHHFFTLNCSLLCEKG